MQIEAGKYYKTRDGRKVGPMVDFSEYSVHLGPKEDGLYRKVDGVYIYGGVDSAQDLIEEWSATDTTPADESNLAALAAQHGIKITVMIGDAMIIYDGRG